MLKFCSPYGKRRDYVVNPGSKAAQRGIREGDFISSINGQSTRGITNQEAHALLRNAGDTLTLGLNQENIGSPKRRVQKIQQDSKEDSLKRTSIASTSSTLSNISTINRILSNSYQSNEASTHTSNGLGTPREAEQFTAEYISYKKNNGATDVGQSRDTPDDDTVVSDHNQLEHHTIIARPSGCNVEAHTATDSDTQVISGAAPGGQHCATASDNTVDPLLDTLIMADNINGSSRSRKQRRSRSNRKRSKKCTTVTQDVSVGNETSTPTSTQPTVQSDIDDNNTLSQVVTTDAVVNNSTSAVEECVPRCDNVATDATDSSAVCSETTTYRVESPKTVRVERKTTIAASMVKSRSLDDDDQVKITEITADDSAERTVCVSESTAIVSEAESDVEWEIVGELETGNDPSAQHFGKLSVISLPLQEYRTYEPSYISPEDERSLRDFLQGLNLVNSPEESVQRIEKTSTETVKSRRSRKREALAQHFLPYYQNPRFLDVISEEGSDTSDKDNRQPSAGVLRCIVDCNAEYLEDEDDVFEDTNSVKEQKLRNRFQSHYAGSGVGEGAILVGTKLIETNVGCVDTSPLKEATWSTTMTEIRSGAEVVYLEDSSESMTPSDLLDETTGDLDADDEDDISIDLDKSFSESLDVQTSDSSSLIKSDVTLTSSSDNTVSRASLPTDISAAADDQTKLVQHHTSPATPDRISTNDTPTATAEVEISNPLDEKSIDSLPRLALTSPKSNKDVNISFSDNISANSNSSAEETESENVEQKSLSEGLNKVINDISNGQNEKEQQNGRENEEELNREIKLFCENLNRTATSSDEYSNGLGGSENNQSRPNSSSSAGSSSRSTSQCTAVYNPVHSSLTNIAAMLREGSYDDRVLLAPSTLRELCVRALLTMPFGKEVIEELADVSLSIEEMTSETPSRIQNIVPIEPKPEPVLPPPPPSSSSSSSSTYHHYQSYDPNKPTNTDASSVILVNNKHSITDIPSRPATVNWERWIGLPTEVDPNLLVYLSPSQRNFIDTTKILPKEADSLLDLHRKFIERRGYHEEYEMPPPTSNKEIPPFQINIGPQTRPAYKPTCTTENNLLKILQNSFMHTTVQPKNVRDMNHNTPKPNSLHNVHINYNNYVKQFTKEIPTPLVHSRDGGSENKVTHGNICYDKYIKQVTREVPIEVERQIHKPVNNKIYEAACSRENRIADGDESSSSSIRKDQRLNARHLGEWLNLARNDDGNKRHNYTEYLTRVSNLHSTVNQLVTQRSCEENTDRTRRSNSPRRHSLPFNLYEQQMQYILEKERQIQQEIEKLNEEKAKLETDMTAADEKLANETTPSAPAASVDANTKQFDAGKYQISRKGDIAILQTETEKTVSKPVLSPTTEKFRQEMYHEYMCKIAERQERKQNKVIKIKITSSKTSTDDGGGSSGGGGDMLSPQCEVKHACGIEDEFMSKVRERKGKLGLEDDEEQNDEGGGDRTEQTGAVNVDGDKNEPILVMDGTSFTDTKQLPKHLQEFVDIARASTATPDDGVWSPGKGTEPKPTVPDRTSPEKHPSPPKEPTSDEPVPVVWTPRSAGSSPTAERKEFRPVSFESPVLGRKNKSKESTPVTTPDAASTPWEGKVEERTQDVTTTTLSLERRLTTSHSAPAAGLNNLSKLPRAQNPTITLLQKAREGQLPRGALYIEQQQHLNQKQRSSKDERPPIIGPNEILYTVKNEYMSEPDSEKPKKMSDLGPRKFEGIGPTTKDGMPIVLRSEIKDANQAKWYKRMYDTLHRSRHDDEYVTVRYKTHRGRYPYTSAGGYLSEPEPNAYDSDVGISASKYATLDRRRLQPNRDKENEYITYTIPRNKYMSASVKHSTDIYKNQPGRIEDYVPGHSSISEKEAKEHLEQQKHVPSSKSYMSHALKESGYESDSTLVFRRREDAALQLNPHDQKEAYKTIQRGGEVPLHGLRKPAPERPKEPVLGPTPPPKGRHDIRDIGSESPRKYVEDEVTIHYRSPVRHEIKEVLSEEELARRQAEAMRRIYQEERRRKYLQELQDMNSRRHTDNFIPSQKSPIPLNRYDDFVDDLSLKVKPRDRSPEPRLVARALYNFVGQSSRELTFRKGDIIFIRRQVDKNWYEGEHNAMIGLFPFNYVEIIPYDGIKSTPRKAHDGQARAKFNFIAQTHLELSLAKGELVVLTRRVDDNWYEGRIGSRKGIFPVSYVEMLIDPNEKQQDATSSSKPVASPAAHSLLLNGSAGGKESMGSHHYQPSYTVQPTTTSYHAKPVNVIGTSASYTSLSKAQKLSTPSVSEALHIDTHSEPVPYRALYKYRPQNDDELELQEGDTVFVLEKCDDGWYVGSSQRTGAFGTFPGNYVERI